MAIGWRQRRQVMYYAVAGVIAAVLAFAGYSAFFSSGPSCFDGTQNGTERGVDCGGACSLLCRGDSRAPVVQWARAFNTGPGTYSAVAYIQNNNPGAGAKQVHYTIQLYDEDNTLVIEKDGVANLPPVLTIPLFEPRIDVGYRSVAKTLFSFSEVPVWRATGPLTVPRTTNRVLAPDASKLTATLINDTLQDVAKVTVVAVLFDAQGVARAASQTVSSVPRKSTAGIVFTWPGGVPNIVRAEITVLPTF